MKISKKLLSMLSLSILVLSLAACSKAASNKSVADTTKKQTGSIDSKKTDATVKPVSGKISEDLYHYDVSLNGVVYTLPTSFSTLEKNGWVGTDFTKDTLEPDQYKLETLTNGKQIINIKITNFGVNVSPLSDCLIGGISIDSDNKKNGTTLAIAKGIAIDSTYDEVIAAYGKASEEYKGDTINKLTYKSGTYSDYAISIDTTTKKVISIDIENLVPPATAETTAVDTELPAEVKNYKAPSSLGTDLFAFQVKYGGVLYKLPVPINELVKNGWVLQSDGAKVIAAKSSAVGIELRKDNQVLRTQIQNYSDKGQPLKNCFATYVEYYNNGAMISLELPKGISEKSTMEEVTAAYGKPDETEESSSLKFYTYGKIFQEVSFTTENGKIQKISVSYSPKELK